MSSDVKTQVVWLPDGFGGGGHAEVCRASDYAALEADNARFQSAIVGMIDLAHEYRHLLTQQRFPDNDEGDAFRRHRDAQVARIERILSAAHAAKVKSHE